MRLTGSLLPFVLLALATATTARPQEDVAPVAAFEKAYAEARALGAEGRWREARQAWIALLDAHQGADYVRPKLPDIGQSLRRATFWEGRQEPDPRTLVTGKIHRYDRSSGRLRIEYDLRHLGDFERSGAVMVHPAVFRRRYSLELRGLTRQLTHQAILVALDGERVYAVALGFRGEKDFTYTMHQLIRVDGEHSDVVDRAEPKVRKNEPVEVKISVTESAIKVTYEGRTILSAHKDYDALGHFGFGLSGKQPLAFEKLIVDGTVEASWLGGLVDAAVQDEWQAFESTYTEPAVLSAWGAPGPPASSTRDPGELASMIPLPDALTQDQAKLAQEIMSLISGGRAAEAAARLGALDSTDLPEATREALLGVAWLVRRRFAAALEHFERSAVGHPQPYELRRLRTLLLDVTEERARAIEELEQLLDEKPGDPGLYADLAEIHLTEGRPLEARSWLERGLAVAPDDADLDHLRGQIVKATQGPAWKDPFSVQTERFVVASDLDPRVCRVAGRELDAAFARYEERLGSLPEGLKPSRVYMFSGEAGYLAYVDGVRDDSPENTAGLYSPALKQILAWNQPSREELFRVLRHEAMHRFMDIRLGDSPRWFGEGVAEFFAVSKQGRDEWEEGALYPEHMRTIESYGGKTIPLETFLYADDQGFLADPELCYAQSWAFVDFLLTTDGSTRALFQRLWRTLEGHVDVGTAVDRVFGGVDLEQLDADFQAHVAALRSR